jgi:hypothetical protein
MRDVSGIVVVGTAVGLLLCILLRMILAFAFLPNLRLLHDGGTSDALPHTGPCFSCPEMTAMQ